VAESLPLYLLGSFPGEVSERLSGRLPHAGEATPVADPRSFPSGDHPPGWVAVSPQVPLDTVLGLLRRLGDAKGPWSPLLVEEGCSDGEETGDVRLLPLSPGLSIPLARNEAGSPDDGARGGLLSHRLLLKELARLRHDVNNPLTAALAEVQLLRMDHPPGTEEGEALAVVEEQLKRIRDMVADLAAYRVQGW
jgi:signal transduction histidine kinase